MGFVSATTPETIAVDGDVSEWSADTEMGTDSNGVSLHVTWDADNFYVAWTGTDWASTSDGADLFVYFNTSEGGSVLSKDGFCFIYHSPQTAALLWKTHLTISTFL